MAERSSTYDTFATAPGFISARNCKELVEFDRRIESGVFEIDRDSDEAITYLGGLYDNFYNDIFRDLDLYRKAKDFTRAWTSWDKPQEFVDRTVSAWQKIISGHEPETYNDHFLYDLYSSRTERWRRLSEMLGIDTPEGFRLFRGMHGEEIVRAVSEGWLDEAHGDMRVRSNLLSSWSLSRGGGKDYSFNHYPNASVLFAADIQFANTLADKWVDDGSFILPCFRECEVIVATADIDEIVVAKQDVQVMLNYKAYRFEDRHELAKAIGE